MRSVRARFVSAFVLLSLACKGGLIEPRVPGGGNPGSSTPLLALRVGGTGADQIVALARDASNNVYVTGSFSGTVDFDPGTGVTALTSLGASDLFLAEYSGSGALIWVDRIGGTGSESVTSLVRDGSGNLYLGGGFDGTPDFDPGAGILSLVSVGLEDGFVAKYGPDGSAAWARRFGGTAGDEVRSLALDAGGNVYAVGSFSGQANALPVAGPSITSDGSEADGFALSLSGSGTVRWAFAVGGIGADVATAVRVTSGGTVAIAGSFTGSADFAPGAPITRLTSLGGQDIFIAAYSTAGDFLWAKGIGGTGEDVPTPGALTVDAIGGLALAGRFAGTADFDPGPATANRTAVGTTDLFVARLDGTGSFESVFTLGGTSAALSLGGLAFDDGGNLLVSGSFAGAVDFDPGVTTRIISSFAGASGSDVFTAQYTPAGGLLWISRFGDGSAAAGANAATVVVPDGSNGAIVAGRFFTSPNFDPGTGSYRLTSLGDADGFVVRLGPTGGLVPSP